MQHVFARMHLKKKGQGLPVNVMVLGAIGIIVLLLIAFLVSGGLRRFNQDITTTTGGVDAEQAAENLGATGNLVAEGTIGNPSDCSSNEECSPQYKCDNGKCVEIDATTVNG